MEKWVWIRINVHVSTKGRKLGITPEPICGLPRYNNYSLNLQMCETGDSIGLSAHDFGLSIQKKSPSEFIFFLMFAIINYNLPA